MYLFVCVYVQLLGRKVRALCVRSFPLNKAPKYCRKSPPNLLKRIHQICASLCGKEPYKNRHERFDIWILAVFLLSSGDLLSSGEILRVCVCIYTYKYLGSDAPNTYIFYNCNYPHSYHARTCLQIILYVPLLCSHGHCKSEYHIGLVISIFSKIEDF